MNKKILMMAAAAMMFAACSNDADTIKESAELAQNSQTEEQAPVLFGAYLNRATTRAGDAGEVTLGELKNKGFGVFGYYTDGELYSDFAKPNFMYNEKVSGEGWTYEPVKYWPNEFGLSAISDELDRVSFFAYGPYVKVTESTGVVTGDHTSGIIGMTRNTATGDPYVKYAVSTDPANQVDFIWGVAADDISPQPIIGGAHKVTKGTPFLDLIKPAAGEKIKFDFHHALAALNVQVDALFDTDTAPSANNVDNNSKIYVRSITFEGIATEGAFNLNQAVTGASWSELCGCSTIEEGSFTIYDGLRDGREGAGIEAANEKTVGLNNAIIQKSGSAGVTNTAVNLFNNSTTAGDPIYIIPATSATTPLKVNIVYDVETVDSEVITTLSDGVTKGVSTTNNITKVTTLNLEAGKKYTLKLHLGMTSVKFEAAVTGWDETTAAEEVMLPINKGSNEGVLNNSLFKVSADNKYVHFTPGNLQWINTNSSNASEGYWKIADSQYSYLGNKNAVPGSDGKVAAGSVDLFGWGQVTPGSMYGSTDNTDYVNSITSGNQQLPDNYNWATKFNNGTILYAVDQPYQKPTGDGDYVVLTKDEWWYLFANHWWGYATVQLTGGGSVNGIVVCPRGTSETTAKSYLSDNIQKSAYYPRTSSSRYEDNSIKQEVIDNNGLLFLPAAGYRSGTSLDRVGSNGYYWSTTSTDEESAFSVYFFTTGFSSDGVSNRYLGHSVRLATVAQ